MTDEDHSHERKTHDDAGTDRRDERSRTSELVSVSSRRSVLKAAGATVGGIALGTAAVGQGSSSGIPTPPLARCDQRLVDPNGNRVLLRGVNVADPGRQLRLWRGQTAEETIALALDESATAPSGAEVSDVTGWHNDVIRLPTQPQDIYAGTDNGLDYNPRQYMPHGDDWGPVLPGEVGDSPAPITGSTLTEYFGEIVDPLIDQIEQAGAYVMIDYHRHFPIFQQARIDWESTDYQCSEETFANDLGGCGERGVLWHGADQTDEVEANAPQAVLDAYGGVYTEPREVAEALDDELTTYWSFVADRYADRDHVLFDVYGDPTGPYAGDWGAPTRMPYADSDLAADSDGDPRDNRVWWDLWVERAQPWIDVVEENAPGSVVTIGTPRWSQYTHWADDNELAVDSVQQCYSGHSYQSDFDLAAQFGPPSQNVPIFFNEFGWVQQDLFDYSYLFGGTSQANPSQFETFIDNYPVHPIAAWFDHTWEPYFFTHEDAEGTNGSWMQHIEPYEDRPGQWWMEYAAIRRGTDEPTAGTDPFDCSTIVDDECYFRPERCTTETIDGTEDPETGAYDLDGDGRYQDLNANGRLDSDDVVTYFERMSDLQSVGNPSYYDYNENGRIDFDDLVTLFEAL